jgi:hypothetical protein
MRDGYGACPSLPPAEGGRRPPAGPALRRVEKVVTSDRRIDRPAASGSGTTAVRGTAVRTTGVRHTDQTCVSGESRCPRPELLPGRMFGPSPIRRHQCGHLSGLSGAPPTCQRACACGWTRPRTAAPQATAASMCDELDQCPAGIATPAARVRTGAMLPRSHYRTLPLRPSSMLSNFRTPTDTLPRPMSPAARC